MPFSILILFTFMSIALLVDYIHLWRTGNPRNFMFFFFGDGTPFTFFDEHLSFGVKQIYQLWIYVLQCGYMAGFYGIYYATTKQVEKRKAQKEAEIAEENAQ